MLILHLTDFRRPGQPKISRYNKIIRARKCYNFWVQILVDVQFLDDDKTSVWKAGLITDQIITFGVKQENKNG